MCMYKLEEVPRTKEHDSKHFVSDSIFERLKFDFSSSETVPNHEVKNDFLGDCVFLEIRLTYVS